MPVARTAVRRSRATTTRQPSRPPSFREPSFMTILCCAVADQTIVRPAATVVATETTDCDHNRETAVLCSAPNASTLAGSACGRPFPLGTAGEARIDRSARPPHPMPFVVPTNPSLLDRVDPPSRSAVHGNAPSLTFLHLQCVCAPGLAWRRRFTWSFLMSFESLGLAPFLLRALAEQGYETPPRSSSRRSRWSWPVTTCWPARRPAPARPLPSACRCCSTWAPRRRPSTARASRAR